MRCQALFLVLAALVSGCSCQDHGFCPRIFPRAGFNDLSEPLDRPYALELSSEEAA